MNFLKALNSSPKVRSVRAKMKKADAARKALSREYERARKAAAAQLKKKLKKKSKAKPKRRR